MSHTTEVVRNDATICRHGWPQYAEIHYEIDGRPAYAVMPSGTVWSYEGLDGFGLPLWRLDDGQWMDVQPDGPTSFQIINPPPGGPL